MKKINDLCGNLSINLQIGMFKKQVNVVLDPLKYYFKYSILF